MLKNDLETMVTKVKHLEDHNQFLDEHESLVNRTNNNLGIVRDNLQDKE